MFNLVLRSQETTKKKMEVGGVRVKLLGSGSYGVVHLVKTVGSVPEKLYAVKSSDETVSSSLRKERQVLAQFIGSPNIVQCFGGFTSFRRDEGNTYNLFLEYASGGSMLDLMRDYGGRIPERDAMLYAKMILEGLVDIHQKGFVHSDLKPDNILVFPKDGDLPSLKIADFGLVKQLGVEDEYDDTIWEYGFQGTPDYMSPESVLGVITGALDVWSLGCIIVQLVTGRSPWDCRNMKVLRDKLLSGETPEIPENMSVVGKNFLMKCFDRDPQQRWTASMLLCHPSIPPNDILFSLTKQLLYGDLSVPSSNFEEKRILLQSPPGFSRSRRNVAVQQLQSPPGFSRSTRVSQGLRSPPGFSRSIHLHKQVQRGFGEFRNQNVALQNAYYN